MVGGVSALGPLPPGQSARADFPRFGLSAYAKRFPQQVDRAELTLVGPASTTLLQTPLAGLPRVEQVSDFHCVTTWSHRSVRWSGVRFADFYERHIAGKMNTAPGAMTLVFHGQDGYRTALLLDDLLAADVLLADRLNGLPLSLAHGAPLRLVAPAHYGYKSVKHLCRMEVLSGPAKLKKGALAFLDHPRARVALEERGRWFPGWLLRLAYRPLVKPAAAEFARALAEHERQDR